MVRQLADRERALTLRDIIAPLFRKKWIVLGTFLLVVAATNVLAWRWANHYFSSEMQIVVGRERSEPTVTPQPNAPVQDSNKVVTTDDVASEVALLQGRDMLRDVVLECKLADVEDSSS